MWKVLDSLGFIVSCVFLAVLVGVQIVSMYRGYDTSYPLLIIMLFALFGMWCSGSLLWKKRDKINNQEKEN